MTFLYSPIKTDDDICVVRNRMGKKYYPVDMGDCEVVGINGDCGSSCPVLLRGECPCADDMCPKDNTTVVGETI